MRSWRTGRCDRIDAHERDIGDGKYIQQFGQPVGDKPGPRLFPELDQLITDNS